MLVRTGLIAAALLASQALASEWQFTEAEVFKQRLADNEHMLVAFVAVFSQLTEILSELTRCLTSQKSKFNGSRETAEINGKHHSELSKPLLPEWKKLREQLPSTAALNCTSIPIVCREADVSSFPAIRLYQDDGTMVRYRGPRKAASIAPFVRRLVRPVVTELTSQTLPSFYTIDDIVVVAQLRDEDEALFGHFFDVAEEYHDRYSFGIHDLPQGSASSTIVCRNNLDDVERASSDLDRVGALEELLEKCATPLVLPLTRRNELIFNQIAKSPVYYFSEDDDDRIAYTSIVRPVAKMFDEFLAFATVDTNEYPTMPQVFGLGSKRGLCLQHLQNGLIFHFPDGEAISTEAVQGFIMAVSEGKMQPWTGEHGGKKAHDEL